MADYVIISTPFGNIPIAADEVGTNWHQRLKMQFGADGVATDVSASDPLPISDAGGSITVDGTVTVQDGGGSITVDDGGGTITVDGTISVSAQGLKSIPINGATLAASPAADYAPGNAVGELMTLPSVAVVKAAKLDSITLKAAGGGTGTWDMTVFIFNENPSSSTIADDTAISLHASDYMNIDAFVEIVDADWKTISGRKYCFKPNIGALIGTESDAYAVIMADAAFNGPANDLEISFGFTQG